MSETYDPDRPCPKCGNTIISTEFRRGHHGISAGWATLAMPYENQMVRHCGRCDFRWYETPLDEVGP